MLTKILYFVQNKSFNIIYLLIFWQNKLRKKFFIHTCAPKDTQSHQNWTFAQSVAENVLLSSISTYQMFGAKLFWCQIVRCQIVLVSNCPGVKLSECQIVHFYYLKSSIWPFLLTLNDLLNFDHFRHTAHIYRSSPVKDNCTISVVLSFNNQLSDRPVLARFWKECFWSLLWNLRRSQNTNIVHTL